MRASSVPLRRAAVTYVGVRRGGAMRGAFAGCRAGDATVASGLARGGRRPRPLGDEEGDDAWTWVGDARVPAARVSGGGPTTFARVRSSAGASTRARVRRGPSARAPRVTTTSGDGPHTSAPRPPPASGSTRRCASSDARSSRRSTAASIARSGERADADAGRLDADGDVARSSRGGSSSSDQHRASSRNARERDANKSPAPDA